MTDSETLMTIVPLLEGVLTTVPVIDSSSELRFFCTIVTRSPRDRLYTLTFELPSSRPRLRDAFSLLRLRSVRGVIDGAASACASFGDGCCAVVGFEATGAPVTECESAVSTWHVRSEQFGSAAVLDDAATAVADVAAAAGGGRGGVDEVVDGAGATDVE